MGPEEDLSQVSATYHQLNVKKNTPQYLTDTELYNLEQEWLRCLPPSDQQLAGKLFKGWYQPEDITNYKLAELYKHCNQIDMKAIIDDIPSFIVSCRSLQSNKSNGRAPLQPASITNPPQNHTSDSSLPSSQETDNTLPSSQESDSRLLTHICPDCRTLSSAPQTLYIMLDYLLEISVPKHYLKHFNTFQNKVQNSSPRSRPQSAHRTAQRWVFTASHCSVATCYGNLFHSLTDFIPVLVVQFDAFQSFVEVCDKYYVIVRLPPTHANTTGYTKYWIQQIARKLALQQIWILDDQVKSLYRTLPCQRLPLTKQGNTWRYDQAIISSRLGSFNVLMKHLEKVMLEDEDHNPNNPISVLGISNEICALDEPYFYNIPFGFVLLNLRNLNLKDIRYHPELHQLEDQVLSCEAVKAGQRVFVCNSFVLLDSNWNVDTTDTTRDTIDNTDTT